MRHIDVLTAIATSRRIEAYESTLDIHVSAPRTAACFNESLKLRSRLIEALKQSGLAENEINEGGGNVSHNSWSSTKSVSHQIIVRSSDMKLLIKAMGEVEHVLASSRNSLFSRIKRDFTFYSPKPIYAPSESADDAIANAMKRARSIADSIAVAQGETIDRLISVVELSVASQRSIEGHDELESNAGMDLDDHSGSLGCIGEYSYSALEQPMGRGTRRFRVRFLIADRDN